MTLDLGLRWEGTWQPEVFIEPQDAFFAPYLDDFRFPSDGRIPDDLDNFQPRVGLAWDLAGDGRTVLRANGGSYVARIPMLVFAQHLTTNGAFQQVLFRSSADTLALGPVPPIDELIDASIAPPFLPDIQVADRNLDLPRTWSFSTGLDRDLGRGAAWRPAPPSFTRGPTTSSASSTATTPCSARRSESAPTRPAAASTR